MAFTVTVTEHKLEIAVESEDDWPKALRALRRLLAGSARPNRPGRSGERGKEWRLSPQGRRLMPGWLAVLRRLAETPEGISADEVCHALGSATVNGIGRATLPIKRLLAERKRLAWSKVAWKVRTGEGTRWRAGPKIAEGIKVVEEEIGKGEE